MVGKFKVGDCVRIVPFYCCGLRKDRVYKVSGIDSYKMGSIAYAIIVTSTVIRRINVKFLTKEPKYSTKSFKFMFTPYQKLGFGIRRKLF